MKVKQFINKFMYASSDIHHVYLISSAGHQVEVPSNILSDPMNHEYDYREEYSSTFVSFRIRNGSMMIHCK